LARETIAVNNERTGSWSRYWTTGALHSCPGSYAGNYSGEIAAFWCEVAHSFAAGSCGIDIGCGNAPVADLIFRYSDPKRLPTIHLLDAATIAPPWLHGVSAPVREHSVLHPGTLVEAMPFDSASIDWAVSQYGIEYSDLDCSLAELVRVLKPNGHVALVMHATDSVLADVARVEVTHCEWLLHAQGPIVAAARLLEPMSRVRDARSGQALRHDAAANEARQNFNACMRALDARVAVSEAPDILLDARHVIAQIFGGVQTAGLSWGESQLLLFRQMLSDSQLRSSELIQHALGESALARMAEVFRGTGRRVQTRAIHDRQRKMGWALNAIAP